MSAHAAFASPNPPGGRTRMPLEQRAKIFTPFDPLDGFSAALQAVEEQIDLERLAVLAAEKADLSARPPANAFED